MRVLKVSFCDWSGPDDVISRFILFFLNVPLVPLSYMQMLSFLITFYSVVFNFLSFYVYIFAVLLGFFCFLCDPCVFNSNFFFFFLLYKML